MCVNLQAFMTEYNIMLKDYTSSMICILNASYMVEQAMTQSTNYPIYIFNLIYLAEILK